MFVRTRAYGSEAIDNSVPSLPVATYTEYITHDAQVHAPGPKSKKNGRNRLTSLRWTTDTTRRQGRAGGSAACPASATMQLPERYLGRSMQRAACPTKYALPALAEELQAGGIHRLYVL